MSCQHHPKLVWINVKERVPSFHLYLHCEELEYKFRPIYRPLRPYAPLFINVNPRDMLGNARSLLTKREYHNCSSRSLVLSGVLSPIRRLGRSFAASNFQFERQASSRTQTTAFGLGVDIRLRRIEERPIRPP